jgi:hypothetical protein
MLLLLCRQRYERGRLIGISPSIQSSSIAVDAYRFGLCANIRTEHLPRLELLEYRKRPSNNTLREKASKYGWVLPTRSCTSDWPRPDPRSDHSESDQNQIMALILAKGSDPDWRPLIRVQHNPRNVIFYFFIQLVG